MTKKTKDYESALLERLRNADYAAEYLNAVIEDESDEDFEERFLIALRDVAKAYGITNLSEQTELWRKSLYKALSREGNPRFSTLIGLLHAMGLTFQIASQKKRSQSA
jgi:probable addiction module antidote protein